MTAPASAPTRTGRASSLLLPLSATLLLLLQGSFASLDLDTAHVIRLRINNASSGEHAREIEFLAPASKSGQKPSRLGTHCIATGEGTRVFLKIDERNAARPTGRPLRAGYHLSSGIGCTAKDVKGKMLSPSDAPEISTI